MHFSRNMVSIGEGIAGASNAHLAELLLRELTIQDKAIVLNRMVEMFKSSGGSTTVHEETIRRFNEADGRVSQLNIIALALANLGYESPLEGEAWMHVTNPFELVTDHKDIEANAEHMRTMHGINIVLPRGRIDFSGWLIDPVGIWTPGRLQRTSTRALRMSWQPIGSERCLWLRPLPMQNLIMEIL